MIRIRFRAFKSPKSVPGALVCLAAMLLAACGPDAPAPSGSSADKPDSAEAGYLAPPSLEGARRGTNGIVLSGHGAPDADLRLGSPTGEVVMGKVDGLGQWRVTVPKESGVRLFGLSLIHGGRTVQAEGYVMVAEGGDVALLRAGAGAHRLAPGSSAPRILTIDVDREGGAVVSGVATPGAGLNARVDRITRGGGRTDDNGRFYISLTDALGPGVHDIQVAGEGGETAISVSVAPVGALVDGPVRADRTADGWRVDWLTPGGGVQSTYLIGDGQ